MNLEFSDGHKLIIGMVHCLPLPGTYKSTYSISEVVERAVKDAIALEKAGFKAILVENEDLCLGPHMSKVQFAGMSMVVYSVKQAVSIDVGVTCGCANYEESLSIALSCGCSFIRTPVFVDTLINYNGIISPCSAQLINYRKQIGAEHIKVFADVQVKHYHMFDKNIPIEESASWAQRQGADAIIVTGCATGVETKLDDIKKVKNKVKIPVVVGSGITVSNIKAQAEYADIFIVGTSIRKNGKMNETIDEGSAKAIIEQL